MPSKSLDELRAKWYGWILGLCCLLFGSTLAAFAYTGYFARLIADDYCYNGVLNSDGFWKGQVSFYLYTSDRYSVIPLVGLSEFFGPTAIRFWPVIAVVLTLVSLTWALKPLGKVLNRPLRWYERLLLAEIITFFTLWQAPNIYQILYWRTGMLTYYMPLIFLVWLLGVLVSRLSVGTASFWAYAGVVLLAWVTGGFSETNTALQAGFLGVILAIALFGRFVGLPYNRLWVNLLTAAFAGTLLAMVTLFISPSNSARMVHMVGPADPVTLVTLSFRFGLDFITDTFSSQPLPSLVSILVAFAFGMAYCSQQDKLRFVKFTRIHLLLVAALLGTYLMIVCTIAPSVYVEIAYPEQRAQIAARFAMTVGMIITGWIMGELAYLRFHRAVPLFGVGAVLLLVFCSLYALRATQVTVAGLPAYQQRAAAWDARDIEIRQQIAQGELDIVVNALDSAFGLMEFQPAPNQWPNNCISATYQVRSITGINP